MTPAPRRTNANNPRRLIRALQRLSRQFDPDSAAEKIAILRRLQKLKLTNPTDIRTCHDLLCFMRAYPDNATIAAATERELRNFRTRIEYYKAKTRDRNARHLYESGIINTETHHNFGFEITKKLLSSHARALSLTVENNEKALAGDFDGIMQFLVAYLENDTLDNDLYLELTDWLAVGFGDTDSARLRAIFALFDNAPIPRPVIRQLFEKHEFQITWDLTNSRASRTLQRVSLGRKFYQREPLLGRTRDLRAAILRPAPALKKLSKREGARYVQIVNEVLAVRNRELDPLSLANPAEVYLVRLERGLSIAIFGMMPLDRLPLESNFGALLIRNDVPVGYGVAATLLDRVEIAINVFPAFRAGESSFIIEQFFRIFHHHFGSNVFLVRSRQMGDGEEEALLSGAFWFYYKLGFRAVNTSVRALAEREAARMKAKNNYRVPLATMKRLSKTDVYFHIDPKQMADWKELSLINPGYAVTQYMTKKQFAGNRVLGTDHAVRNVKRALSIRDLSRWSEEERVAMQRLAPLIDSFPDLKRWSRREKQELAAIIRAKGGPQERKFVLLSNRHAKFCAALARIARRNPPWAD